jgi:hypothetical protein
MSETNATDTKPAAPAAAPAVTHEHISALHRHIEEVKDFVVRELHKVLEFVKREAPAVAAGAEAIASAVPVVEPIAGAVGKVAGEAAALAAHVAGHADTCSCPGCVAVNHVNK